ncbi:MAG: hypothetical protein WCJ98_14355 [Mycobacteriaceae bacterium]
MNPHLSNSKLAPSSVEVARVGFGYSTVEVQSSDWAAACCSALAMTGQLV